MTIEEKYEKVKEFLKGNNIEFRENVEKKGFVIPLLMPRLGIVIHSGDSQEFYMNVRKTYKPIFIREEEEMDFIIEKVTNTIYDRMREMQKIFENGTVQESVRHSRD